jgi:tetratricopeptide (TPR) repeat protein
LYRQAMQAAQTAFGPQSEELALLLNNMGILFVATGRSEEAGRHFEKALAIWEATLPSDHPHVARSLTNLAAFRCSTGAYSTAEPLFRRALAITESRLGPEDGLAGKILTEYALLLRKTKRKKEAKLLETRAQAIRQDDAPRSLARHTVDLRDLLDERRARRADR